MLVNYDEFIHSPLRHCLRMRIGKTLNHYIKSDHVIFLFQLWPTIKGYFL